MSKEGSIERRVPLVDEMAERQVLGAVLLRPELLDTLELEPANMYSGRHRVIYQTMLDMRAKGEPIDYVSLHSRLPAEHEISLAYISSLTDEVACASACKSHVARVIELYQARQLRSRMMDVIRRLEAGERVDDVAPDVVAASNLRLSSVRRADLQDALARIERYQSSAEEAFCLTGCDSLDKYPVGANELCVIAARPSMGKTALAIHMAHLIASRGAPVLFLSIEMAGDDINLRRVASLSGVSMQRMRVPGLSLDEYDKIVRAFDHAKREPIEVYSGRFSLHDIVTMARRDKMARNTKAVFVDHLACMQLPDAERHDIKYGIVTSALARLAKDIGVTIYLLHQLNRSNEHLQDRRPTLASLRNSGDIEQDADSVWLLYRERYYDRSAGPEMQINVAKNRNGPTGITSINYEEETGRFYQG